MLVTILPGNVATLKTIDCLVSDLAQIAPRQGLSIMSSREVLPVKDAGFASMTKKPVHWRLCQSPRRKIDNRDPGVIRQQK